MKKLFAVVEKLLSADNSVANAAFAEITQKPATE